jgi:hypothetical protein
MDAFYLLQLVYLALFGHVALSLFQERLIEAPARKLEPLRLSVALQLVQFL